MSDVVRHHFSVDVEEVFHSTLLTQLVPESDWDTYDRRAPEIIRWLLDEMDHHSIKGTFFFLGWMAEREPGMVKEVARRGHEIASHSWRHRRVYELTPEEFRSSIRQTKELLEDCTGKPVLGYRAPSFSIIPGTEWAFDVLAEEGYRYDSSLFPTALHPGYGYPGTQLDPHLIQRPSGSIVQMPLLTLAVGKHQVPAAGGAYMRFFPYRLIRAALERCAARGQPGTLYIHPWDLDPGARRFPLPPMQRLRLYGGSRSARRRLLKLLGDHQFQPIAESLEHVAPCPTT